MKLTRYEYAEIESDDGRGDFQDRLDGMGANGWKLVGYHIERNWYHAILERPLPPEKKSRTKGTSP